MSTDGQKLSDDQRRRYARQILLPEIGMAGQASLCAARVALPLEGEAGVLARRYLERAGVHVQSREEATAESGSASAPDPVPASVRRALVGSCNPEGPLAPALAVLAGSLCATQTMQSLLNPPAPPASPDPPARPTGSTYPE